MFFGAGLAGVLVLVVVLEVVLEVRSTTGEQVAAEQPPVSLARSSSNTIEVSWEEKPCRETEVPAVVWCRGTESWKRGRGGE